jgi:hypothetical protein
VRGWSLRNQVPKGKVCIEKGIEKRVAVHKQSCGKGLRQSADE